MLQVDQKGRRVSEAAAGTDYAEKFGLALSKTDHSLGMWGEHIGLLLWVIVMRSVAWPPNDSPPRANNYWFLFFVSLLSLSAPSSM